MHEIFNSIQEKGKHEKEYILQFLPTLKILGTVTMEQVKMW